MTQRVTAVEEHTLSHTRTLTQTPVGSQARSFGHAAPPERVTGWRTGDGPHGGAALRGSQAPAGSVSAAAAPAAVTAQHRSDGDGGEGRT